ncbi:hypothetical protein PMIT1306_00612 [Prochlorococcus sp. MIT 1306]|nr:hypothetical protein PMIT1306_00612 [Prochlorococcus sp. MIT 1306]
MYHRYQPDWQSENWNHGLAYRSKTKHRNQHIKPDSSSNFFANTTTTFDHLGEDHSISQQLIVVIYLFYWPASHLHLTSLVE